MHGADSAPRPDRTPELPPPRLENYRILRPVGHGGMGDVWEAMQLRPVNRRVALKVIRAGIDSRQLRARFEIELQALAAMAHPSIAQVFDAGQTRQGRPYFTMEFIDGVPITRYCDDHQLSIPERLRLFQRVCDGVQHAHQRAVLHRDLKPANVLVATLEGVPTPKIIDFGVAKSNDATRPDSALLTDVGLMVGTPGYMSPEQAAGQPADTRTDVFSLGVILYELLVGVAPRDLKKLSEQNLEGMLRQIREEDPTKPSERLTTVSDSVTLASKRGVAVPNRLRSQLTGDLDWIAMKALERNPDRRYRSPAELSMDIQRYLQNDPILARPPSLAYQLRKLTQRHRTAVIATVASLMALVGFVVVTSVQAGRIARERDRAQLEAETANRYAAFMEDLFKGADPDQTRGNVLSSRELLEQGLEKINSELGDQPELRSRLLYSVAKVHRELGQLDDAERLLVESLELSRQILGPNDAQTLRCTGSLAILYVEQGTLVRGEPFARASFEGLRDVRGADDRSTLRAQAIWGDLLRGLGRGQEAEAIARDVLERRRGALGPNDKDTYYAMADLALCLHDQGHTRDALPLMREAADLIVADRGPDHPNSPGALANLAEMHGALGHLDQAESLYRSALETQARVLGTQHPVYLESLAGLAWVLAQGHRFAEADAVYREVVRGREEVLRSGHPDIAVALSGLASVLENAGQPQEAERLYRRAVAIWEENPGRGRGFATTLLGQAELSRQSGHDGPAAALEERARSLDPTRWEGASSPRW